MEVKGTAVKSIPEYIEIKYSDIYNKWLNSLSVESKEIFNNPIFASKWYNADISILEPMLKLSEILKIEINDLSWDMGILSSKEALSGVYKVFIKISSPGFLINRSSNIISTYYKNTVINIIENSSKKVTLELLNFPKKYEQIIYRIGGWIYNALEAVGSKNIKVELKNIEDSFNSKTFLIGTWD